MGFVDKTLTMSSWTTTTRQYQTIPDMEPMLDQCWASVASRWPNIDPTMDPCVVLAAADSVCAAIKAKNNDHVVEYYVEIACPMTKRQCKLTILYNQVNN